MSFFFLVFLYLVVSFDFNVFSSSGGGEQLQMNLSSGEMMQGSKHVIHPQLWVILVCDCVYNCAAWTATNAAQRPRAQGEVIPIQSGACTSDRWGLYFSQLHLHYYWYTSTILIKCTSPFCINIYTVTTYYSLCTIFMWCQLQMAARTINLQ